MGKDAHRRSEGDVQFWEGSSVHEDTSYGFRSWISRGHAGRHRHHSEMDLSGEIHSADERNDDMAQQNPAGESGSTGTPEAVNDSGKPKLKRKDYEKSLRKLQTELCILQDWVKQTGQRIIVVFEGRDAAGKGGTIRAHDRARQPSHLPCGGAARPIRPRKVADVRAALSRAFPGGRRDRDLRPQLVQPRRRRTRHGVLHQGAAQALPRDLSRVREAHRPTTASGWSNTGSR